MKLPAVRAYSLQLGVAIDTVRKAYDDIVRAGLAKTIHGAGTFISLPQDTLQNADAALWGQIDTGLYKLAESGVDLVNAASRITQRLRLLSEGVNAIFVGVEPSAARYARCISEGLPDMRAVGSATLSDLKAGNLDLHGVTHVVSLVVHRGQVQEVLADEAIRVMSIIARLEQNLVSTVAGRIESGNVILVARPETRTIYETLLADQFEHPITFDFVEDTDDIGLLERLNNAPVVFHTSVATPMVNSVAAGRATIVELQHIPDDRSLKSAQGVLRADHDFHLNTRNTILVNSS